MFLMFLMYIYNPQTFVYTPQFQIPRNNPPFHGHLIYHPENKQSGRT